MVKKKENKSDWRLIEQKKNTFSIGRVLKQRSLQLRTYIWSGAYLKGLTLPKDLRQRVTFGGP
jgi:hypothetical protein